jgi:diguanylate cyclase (GGDEF)-like protein
MSFEPSPAAIALLGDAQGVIQHVIRDGIGGAGLTPGQPQTVRVQNGGADGLYDEFSRLNNELVTLQRDLAKKNAELERLYGEVQRLAITDTLTGLYNRRGFFEIGNREIARSKRFGHPLTAIMFDVDHFKNFNDTYGHAIGDRVLEEIAACCGRQLRKVDILGRYGGEEFSVLLPETSLTDARTIAERLRHAADKPIDVGQATLTVTISLGVAALQDNTADLYELLQGADRALYKAKELGRNCICIEQG